MPAERINLFKTAITLVIDYFRWTQLTPLVIVWAFGIVMLAALVFVNYQEESFDAIAAMFHWIAGLPWIGDKLTVWLESMANDDGSLSAGGLDIKAAALKVWGFLSLAMMLIALVVNWVFGPFKPWTLKRKLGIAAVCCLLLLAAYFAVYFAKPEEFNGPVGGWILNFGGIAVLLFIVSTWCLSIAHLLGLLREGIQDSSLGSQSPSQPPYTVER